jgi:hypothetical protein
MDAGADELDLEVLRRAAVAAVDDLGGAVLDLRRREVHHRPGDEVIVGFDATVRWPDGTERSELLQVATPLGAGAGAARVWCYPADPLLPGLADAVMPQAVVAFLGRAATDVHLEVRALRPCRRAVVAVRGDGLDLHLKVVPPDEVDRVVARHVAFAAADLPVAPVLAVDQERGWVLMATLPGATLDHRLTHPSAPVPGAPVPSADDLAELVERMAAVEVADSDEVPASSDLVDRHAEVLGAAVPALRSRSRAAAAAIEQLTSTLHRRIATVHGDLHAGQLLVDEQGRIVGLLDLDDAGHGDVLDEHGRLLAHLLAIAVLADPAGAARCWSFVADLAHDWSDRFGAAELAPRVAASLLGWATAPWRAQDPSWPERVEALLATTEDVLARGVDATIRSRRSP